MRPGNNRSFPAKYRQSYEIIRDLQGIAILCTLILTVFLTTETSFADSHEYKKYIATASIGANFFDLGNEFDDVEVETSTEFLYSWGFEYRFHENWGAEIRWAGSSGDVELKSSGIEADIDPMYFNGNIIYHFTPESRILPFLTAGLGIAVLDIDRGDTGDSETNLAFNFGGGVWIPLDNRFSLRMEFRDYIYSVDGLSDESAAALDLSTDYSATMNDLVFLTGLNIAF